MADVIGKPPAHERKHRVSIVCDGKQIDGWETYTINTAMLVPADAFSMRRPFSLDAWRALRLDADVQVLIDGVQVLEGFIDKRRKSTRDGALEVEGRCKGGRLVQESAPSINYAGITLVEAVKRLAYPWFDRVVISNARNRSLSRGKGRRVPSGKEPLVVDLPAPSRGKVQPGAQRWSVIEELVSQAGYLAWSTADGRELFIGKPNTGQAPQWLLRHVKPGSPNRPTVKELEIVEDIGDLYSMIAVVGTGKGDDANYGDNAGRRHAIVYDNEENPSGHGTGRNFLNPKRLMMPERDFGKNKDAYEIAEREYRRRSARAFTATARMPYHGQFLGSEPTIFAFDTVARVIDEELELDDRYLLTACTFECSRDDGETTMLEMVPADTEIVL